MHSRCWRAWRRKPASSGSPSACQRRIANLSTSPEHSPRSILLAVGVRPGTRRVREPTLKRTISANHARLDADERRAIAEEFIEVSRKLWDSWEDDAVIADRDRGLYLDPEKLHHINHFGPHFQIRGPQITYRPPQGHPVLVQVDLGDPGTPLSPILPTCSSYTTMRSKMPGALT